MCIYNYIHVPTCIPSSTYTELIVQFSKADYSVDEGGLLGVAVTIEGETSISSDLTLRIVKRNLTEVFNIMNGSVLIQLPPDFPHLETFNEDEPYIASSKYIYMYIHCAIEILPLLQVSI